LDEQYYIRSRGRVQGPFTPTRLKELARRGKFSRYHHISGDRINWERASAHPELFPDVRPPKLRKASLGGGPDLTVPSDTIDELESETEGDAADETGGSEEQEWFYSQGGQQIDEPATRSQLQSLALAGHLTRDDYIWTTGMPNWTEASIALPKMFPDQGISQDQEAPAASVQVKDFSPQVTAPMAVASFVLGLLGASFLFFLGSIFAIVFGHVALKQIGNSENQLGGRGMALAGLILGYIVVGLVIIVGMCLICISILGIIAASS
jgi:hypothetical protein